MSDKDYWEECYKESNGATFTLGPTAEVKALSDMLTESARILDVGCGEGRNAVYLANRGCRVDAFDLSENAIGIARSIAAREKAEVNFFVCDLNTFIFEREYEAIIAYGVLHLPDKKIRDRFIEEMKSHTKTEGINAVGVFTLGRPLTPDNAPCTHGLFAVGELTEKYSDWEIVRRQEGILTDSRAKDIQYEYAYEKIMARRKK